MGWEATIPKLDPEDTREWDSCQTSPGFSACAYGPPGRKERLGLAPFQRWLSLPKSRPHKIHLASRWDTAPPLPRISWRHWQISSVFGGAGREDQACFGEREEPVLERREEGGGSGSPGTLRTLSPLFKTSPPLFSCWTGTTQIGDLGPKRPTDNWAAYPGGQYKMLSLTSCRLANQTPTIRCCGHRSNAPGSWRQGTGLGGQSLMATSCRKSFIHSFI